MNEKSAINGSYSAYCREHIHEFKRELRDEASRAIIGWPGRVAAILLAASSLLNYIYLSSVDSPDAINVMFTYSVSILLVVLYPIVCLIFSTVEKYSPFVLDLLCISGVIGFSITLSYIFHSADVSLEQQDVTRPMAAQVSFVVMLVTAFSFHATYLLTFSRNVLFTLIVGVSLYLVDADFIEEAILEVIQGFLIGSMISWLFFEGIRTRFYLKATDAHTRQHLHKQLSKLVYSHQLERIKLGEELEDTLPLEEGKAIINVFDVQKSGEIRHQQTKSFFLGVFRSFWAICMRDYGHSPLRSRAFRLKETGDGYISAFGYPFLSSDERSLADSAVATSLDMFAAFDLEVEKFNYSRPIKGAMGLAYNSVQGTFQSEGIRSYDLFGDALVQASKYEELRSHPLFADILHSHAQGLGLTHYHIMIVQEVIYNSLSQPYRELFTEINLDDDCFKGFQMMNDKEAKYIYFYLFE
ncbi:MAG: hypothetical protein COC19_08030 [SAR86 cluster bacterium]|uniref:Guanylate cyclase domain-containing protein n=1 Tax=SAR86 cluster bacterium TaxID=2030880 RepID=A0A2A4MGU0_9GAMM|nr:MAG: hypothetical protein COC19_08030 [SAR86 cluster bacterium]